MNVLVVDDESIVRLALKRALVNLGDTVFEAANGEEAIEIWGASSIDLVFLDVLMPRLTGPQVLEEIGEHSAKVVLISAYTGEYNMQRAKNLGANLFIAKPFADIFEVVNQGRGLVIGK